MNTHPLPSVVELDPRAKVTLLAGWQRFARGHVIGHFKLSCRVYQLAECMNPMRTDRAGRLDYDYSTRDALRSGDYVLYTDLLDYGHPLLLHPAHPARSFALSMGVRMPLEQRGLPKLDKQLTLEL